MNKSLYLLAFVAGATAGSVATWLLVKERYAQIAQEEIDSVKEVFSKKETPKEHESISEIAEKAKNKADIMEYAKKLNDMGYTNYSDISADTDDEESNVAEKIDNNDEGKKVMGEEKPYVISPDEFGELDDYDEISLTFYSDQFLADDDDELVENVDRVVGAESLNHFGEYEDDSVFVRNDRLKADFEILLDERKYMDVLKTKPHPREDL